MADLGDELNDELLALAGDDSDEEGSSVADGDRSNKSRSSSASPPPRPSIEKPSTTSSSSRKGAAKPMSRRKQDDSEEEGEASPGPDSPGSLGSGAMDESDSDDDRASSRGDAAGEDDGELYPLEGKYKDARDKAYIRSLPEMQREQILAERQEEKQRVDQAATLRKAIQQSELTQAKKRKAAVADLDESPQKAVRPKDKRAEALQNLKQARESRDAAGRNRAGGRRGRRSRSRSSDSSQRDADGDSEVEFAEEPVRAPPKEQIEATLEEVERLRIGRSRFAQYCFYPTFEQLTGDAFVRIQVVDGVYKMGQIKGYTDGKPYQMELTNGRPCMTDQYATVQTGETSRPWPLTHCSNSRFTHSEYEDWKGAQREAGKRLPTQNWAQKKCADLHTLVNYNLSSEEITAKINKQRRFEHLLAAKQADRASQGQPLDEHAARQQRIAEMNARNRRENQEQIRNALLAKRAQEKEKARRLAREEAARKRAEEEFVAAAAAKAKHLDVDDLFGDGTGASDISRTGTPVNGEGKAKKERSMHKGIPTFSKRKMDDDILGTMDFGIDIEL